MSLYIAVVVKDNFHLANDQHFGDLVYNWESTPKVFTSRWKAIQNAFSVLEKTYKGIKPYSKLRDAYDNELDYYGREFHIIAFDLRFDMIGELLEALEIAVAEMPDLKEYDMPTRVTGKYILPNRTKQKLTRLLELLQS